MFGILHWESNNGNQNEVMFVEQPQGSSNPEKISACDRCRARKVKCRITNDDTCYRCTRLEKRCSFALKTSRGDQHARMPNTNTPELEHSETVSAKSNNLSPVSLSPSENRPENGDFLAGLPEEHAAVGSEHDRSADGLRQDIGDQIAPILPLDSTSSTFVTALDDLFTWATCSGNEVPLTPSSITNFENPSLFGTGFDSMHMSLHTPAVESTAVSCHLMSGQSSCLAASVFAVEYLETRCACGNYAQLDSILASQKKAISCCRSMVNCTSCMAKRENIIVLVFMTEKIVEACRSIIVFYGWLNFENALPSLDSSSSMSLGSLHNDVIIHHGHGESVTIPALSQTRSGTATSSDTSLNWRGLLIGEYEISSSRAWEYLVRLLIFLQLKHLLQLLADIKDTGSKVLGETQMASLTQAERKIVGFEEELSGK